MSFLSRLCLLALLPWTAAVVWLLTGRRERTGVPFLELWRGQVAPLPKARAAMHVPPVAVLLLLLATLLAILAAARPWVVGRSNAALRVVIVIDRGFSMAASWKELLEEAEWEIGKRLSGAPVERVFIPAEASPIIDTRAFVAPAVRRALDDPDSVVFVISDQTLPFDDLRLFQMAPRQRARNVGFAWASASNSPRPQVMARVRNDSPLTTAELRVGAASRPIELPPTGEEKNYFIDVDRLEEATRLELIVSDDLPADNRIELVRTFTWPRLEPAADLPPELTRMIETYRKIRPPPAGATTLVISRGHDSVPPLPAVVVAETTQAITAGLRIEDHPITSAVDWRAIADRPLQIAPDPPQGWTVLLRAAERPLLAIRESPARQVWVGFASDAFARTADFVIFWTNVFDWAGKGNERFVPSGTLAIPISTPPESYWHGKFVHSGPSVWPGREISSEFATAASLMIFAAAVLWGVAKTAR